jgi:serine acetyltransferase
MRPVPTTATVVGVPSNTVQRHYTDAGTLARHRPFRARSGRSATLYTAALVE